MTDILRIQKKSQSTEKSPEQLLSKLRPLCVEAIDASLNSPDVANRAEVVLLLRKEDEHFHIKHTHEESQKIAWGENTRLRREPRLVDDWENIKQREVDRAIDLCRGRMLDKMITALKSDRYLISVEVVLKFKDGRFNWVTYKEELGLC